MPKLITIHQLLDYLGCSRSTLYTIRKKSDFPKPVEGIGVLKFREDDIAAWVASR